MSDEHARHVDVVALVILEALAFLLCKLRLGLEDQYTAVDE